MEYWKRQIGTYIRRKRIAKGLKQQALGPRASVSNMERGRTDFQLSNLLNLLDAVGGDVSDVFRSHVPRSLHREHQDLHETLQQILNTKDQEAIKDVTKAITRTYIEFVSKTPDNSRQ